MRFLHLLLFITVYACEQESKSYLVNPKAKQLSDSAVSVVMRSNEYNKAIELLDEAIKTDNNYSTAFANKVTFQLQLKQFDKALATSKNLLKIKPNVPEYNAMTGMIYDHIGDTISSKKYFAQAAKIYDNVLDTMSKANKNYDGYLLNKAINLICLGQQEKGNEILRHIYNDKKNEASGEIISMFLNKSKREIINTVMRSK